MEYGPLLIAALIAGGLAVLVGSGRILVRGGGALAVRLGVSPLLIGLIVVGFGTSAPELTISVQAALSNAPGIAVGNVIGSNTANILLILAAAALAAPIAVEPRAFRRDGPALALSMLAVAGALVFLPMNRITGALMLGLLGAYIAVSYFTDRRKKDPNTERHVKSAGQAPRGGRLPVALALTALGLTGVVAGAWLLLEGAVALAEDLGVSQTVIGLTVVAVGTSLPELAATVTAARRGEGDMALGVIVGSNIFNGLGILGAAALVAPFEVPARMMGVDLWVMLAASAILIGFAVTGWRLDRREAAIMIGLYAAYTIWLFLTAAD